MSQTPEVKKAMVDKDGQSNLKIGTSCFFARIVCIRIVPTIGKKHRYITGNLYSFFLDSSYTLLFSLRLADVFYH